MKYVSVHKKVKKKVYGAIIVIYFILSHVKYFCHRTASNSNSCTIQLKRFYWSNVSVNFFEFLSIEIAAKPNTTKHDNQRKPSFSRMQPGG